MVSALEQEKYLNTALMLHGRERIYFSWDTGLSPQAAFPNSQASHLAVSPGGNPDTSAVPVYPLTAQFISKISHLQQYLFF